MHCHCPHCLNLVKSHLFQDSGAKTSLEMRYGWSVGIWGNEADFFFWRWEKQVKIWDLSIWYTDTGAEVAQEGQCGSMYLPAHPAYQSGDRSMMQLHQMPAPIQQINPESPCSLSVCFVVMEPMLGWIANKLKVYIQKVNYMLRLIKPAPQWKKAQSHNLLP